MVVVVVVVVVVVGSNTLSKKSVLRMRTRLEFATCYDAVNWRRKSVFMISLVALPTFFPFFARNFNHRDAAERSCFTSACLVCRVLEY